MSRCTGLHCPLQAKNFDTADCKAGAECPWKTVEKTNADRIRKMTDVELCVFLFDMRKNGRDYGVGRVDEILEWLKESVDE